MIYLDNSATTRVLDEAAQAALTAMTQDYHNPASAYAPAAAAEKRVALSRAFLAMRFSASPDEVLYTSGGTESNNMSILGTLRPLRGKRRIITDMTEHPSVYEVFRALTEAGGAEAVILPAMPDGRVSLEALSAALTPDTALVSIMHVNNETGAINDLAAIRAMLNKGAPNAVFHSDGVQAFSKLPFGALPCDLYAISGHKLHAPKGVGALYVRKGTRFAGGQIGGGQERALRAGTTNTPGILALDAALRAYQQNWNAWHDQLTRCKQRLARQLLSIPDAVINGPLPEHGAPHILNVSFPGVRGEVLLNALSERGVYVSTGSACAARKRSKNRILTAMGITGPRQEGAIRFSLCPFNTAEEMDRAASIVSEQVAFLRRYKRR